MSPGWLGQQDSNLRMTESESVALPLGDAPTSYSFMGWVVGFEPTHDGATTRCLNHLTIPTMTRKNLATRTGLEPVTSSVTGWHSNQLNYRAVGYAAGGRYRARTCDPLLVRQVLSQLS